MVELSEEHCASSSVRRRVVYRVDGGYGTQPQIRWMVATQRLFVAKAATTRPQKWADKPTKLLLNDGKGLMEVYEWQKWKGDLMCAPLCAK